MTVEKPKLLVFLHRNLLILLALLFKKTAKQDFFDSLASYVVFSQASIGYSRGPTKKETRVKFWKGVVGCEWKSNMEDSPMLLDLVMLLFGL